MAQAVITKGVARFVIQWTGPRLITLRCGRFVPELQRKCNQLVG